MPAALLERREAYRGRNAFGFSAVQIIPVIASDVEHLTVFQRTPIWCLPKPDSGLAWPLRTALGLVPGSKAAARLINQTYVEVTFPLAAHFHGYVPTALAPGLGSVPADPSGDRCGTRRPGRS